jgi:acyl-CoA thioesterase
MDATGQPDDAAQRLAERAVQAMYERDAASRALGIRILEVRPDFIRAAMTVRDDMVNGHDLCHGGFIFTLADSAFAFCCNSRNAVTVGGSASIDFLAPARKEDELFALATMISRSRRSGLCDVVVSNRRGETIAHFRGRSVQLQGQVSEER